MIPVVHFRRSRTSIALITALLAATATLLFVAFGSSPSAQKANASAATPGYWVASSDGGVFTAGAAPFYGSAKTVGIKSPIVDIVSLPAGKGYWLVAADGGVFTYGDAKFYGSAGDIKLNSPIVAALGTSTGNGYWLIAADGGVFSYGDAKFYGSAGDINLNSPIVDVMGAPSDAGYWLIAADGGVFSYGTSPFFGSAGNIKLNQPVIAASAQVDGSGYRLFAADGGVFSYGSADFRGSMGADAVTVSARTVDATVTVDGNGYWLVDANGNTQAFGTAAKYALPAGVLSTNAVGIERYTPVITTPSPAVNSVAPATGPLAGGTAVTITGTDFTGATAVSFGGTAAASFTIADATTIVATSPSHAVGAVDISVTNPSGNSLNTSADDFVYVDAPTLTSITPTAGTTAGGTSVTFTGTNFLGTTGVKFGTVSAASFHVDSATQITATTPVSAAGATNVSVSSAGGTSTLSNAFTFYASPNITSASPDSGPLGGGNTVTLTGTGLTGLTQVKFDGTNATSLNVVSGTSATVIAPAHAAGTVDIQVTNPVGTATASNAYIYRAAPTISSVSPNVFAGPGGGTVTITGTNFVGGGGTSVTIGGTPVTPTVNSPTSLTFTAPPHAAGSVNVVVTTSGGTATATNAFTYVQAPTISSVTPNLGALIGGTSVTISGNHLATTSRVTFGGVDATALSVVDDNTVTVTTPPHVAGTVLVRVTAVGGVVAANAFTYTADPVITSIGTNVGPEAGATTVAIFGSNLSTATDVVFGNNAASFTVFDDNEIDAVAPAGTGTVDIHVITPVGTSANTVADDFTYVAAPTISSLSTTTGPVAGNQQVFITGTNLSLTNAVAFDGSNATFTVVDDSTLDVRTPAHAAGVADVEVTTPGGTATANNAYTFVGAPTISSVTPNAGPTAGGTLVTVTGSNFVSGSTGVTIGGNVGSSVAVLSSSSLTFVTPAHAAGAVNISVGAPGGLVSSTNAFTYTSAPTIGSVSPTAGPVAGGTSVTVTGTNFVGGGTTVSVGGNSATTTVNSPTSLTVATPAHAAGAVNVVVATSGGTTTATNAFTYTSAPTIGSVSPSIAATSGASGLVIAGTNFVNGSTTVSVDGNNVTPTSVTSTAVTFNAPAHAAGTVDVGVTTPGGTATSTGALTYAVMATINSISPDAGPTAGGTVVTVSGTNFEVGTTSVTIGGNVVTPTVNSSTSLTFTTPAHAAGTVNVGVTTTSGTTTVPNAYSYLSTPTIGSLSPNAGPLVGGTSVTVTGTNFRMGGTNVAVDGVFVTPTVNSATSLTFTTPVHPAGAVDVDVITAGGSATSTGGFTYVDSPTVGTVSPAFAPLAGATGITLTGTNFVSGQTTVNLNGFPVTPTSVTSTSLTFDAPSDNPGTDSLSVTTPGGTSGAVVGGFTYVDAPTATSISPSSIGLSGGTSIGILGSNFVAGQTVVNFDGSPITPTSVTSGVVVFDAPAHAAGTVAVSITTPGGTTSNIPGGFTYVDAPVITSVSPASGPSTGGTTVTITGSGFTISSAVYFGASSASFTFNSPTSITTTSPAHGAGVVDVSVVSAFGTSSTGASDQYTYFGLPMITSLSHTSGPLAGGQSVTITGSDFVAGQTQLLVDGSTVTPTVNSSTSITFTTPAHAAAVVDIQAITPGGSITAQGVYSYIDAPTINSVNPPFSDVNGGTSITINGTNLGTVDSVTFDGVPGTSLHIVNAVQLTVVTPAHADGDVDVVVSSPSGSATATNAVRYTVQPLITNVTPAGGPSGGGTTVTITGVGFLGLSGGPAVTFGNNDAASYTVDSETQITAVSPAGTGTVDIQLATPIGLSNNNSGDEFTYSDAPSITSVSPTSGPLSGGQTVTVTGTNFVSGGTSVLVDGNTVSPTVNSPTSLEFTTDPHAAGAVDVQVITADGSATSVGGYEYVDAPTISAVTPPFSDTAGGTSVTVDGTGFDHLTDITFDGISGTSLNIVSSTQATVVTPAHADGDVDVEVSSPSGSATAVNAVRYTVQPLITSITPTVGPEAGGTSVIITGVGFLGLNGGPAVQFGPNDAASYTVDSETQITATAPAGIGTVDISLATPVGISVNSSNDQFTYYPAPDVMSVSPNIGRTGGGTAVTLSGSGFTGATAVLFDSTPASFTVNSDSSITVTSPANGTGPVDITVTGPGGISSTSSNDRFTYYDAPIITSLSPTLGDVAGGDTVTIAGSNFTGVTSVTFGGVSASFTFVNDGEITVTTPPGSPATVDVVVTAAGGTSTPDSNSAFTYSV